MASKNSTSGEYTNINIETLNIDGISSIKMALLEDYMMESMPDVIGLQETKVNVDNLPPNMDIVGYNHAVNERTSDKKSGGGLVIYWKDTLPGKIWSNPNMNTTSKAYTEIQWLLIETGNSRIAIANTYMACTSTKNKNYVSWNTEIYNQLVDDVNVLRDMCCGIIMMGDFNAWIGKHKGMQNNHSSVNENGKLLLDFVENNELFIMNKLNTSNSCFTRRLDKKDGTNLTQSCLDYFLMSNESRTGKWNFTIHDMKEENGINTDHSLLRITGSVLVTKTTKKRRRDKPGFTNKVALTKYKKELKDQLNNISLERFSSKTMTEQAHFLHTAIKTASKRRLVKKSLGKGMKRKRRINGKMRNLLKEKKEIKDQIKTHGNTRQLKESLAEKQTEIKDALIEGILERRKKIRLDLALKDKNKKTFWRMLKRSPIKNVGLTAAWNKDKKLVFEPAEVRKAVYDSFKGRLNGHDNPQPVPPKMKEKKTKHSKKLSKPVTLAELRSLIPKIKKGTTCGPFEIYAEHIIYGGITLLKYIKIWINNMLEKGIVPEFLKQGRISLLYKRDDCLDPKNYRPICISSVLLKLFTRLLNTRLEQIVEENNMLCDLQYGFRKRKSTMDAIMVVTTAIEKSKLDELDAGIGKKSKNLNIHFILFYFIYLFIY